MSKEKKEFFREGFKSDTEKYYEDPDMEFDKVRGEWYRIGLRREIV